MSQLVKMVQAQGIEVTGSDISINGHNPINVMQVDAVVYTSAVANDNVELVEARRLGIPIVERAALLGQISQNYSNVIAVAGTHGKTTTTIMIGAMLASRNPTIHVGGDSIGVGGNRIGGKSYFVTEACEYRRNFLYLRPHIGVVLNMDLDHVDCYADLEQLIQAYNSFVSRCDVCVVHTSVVDKIHIDTDIVTFGQGGDYTAINIVNDRCKTTFDCCYRGVYMCTLTVNMQGQHNIDNCLASVGVCRCLGLDNIELEHNILGYEGVKRRFEILSSDDNCTIVSDYAHHPEEIKASLTTARSMRRHVRVLFQPHTYSRTRAFLQEFADALSTADEVGIAPIFAAREIPDGTTSLMLVNIIEGAILVDNVDDMRDFVYGDVPDDSCTIIMGAGDIDKILRV